MGMEEAGAVVETSTTMTTPLLEGTVTPMVTAAPVPTQANRASMLFFLV